MSAPHSSKWATFKEYVSHREVRRSLPSSSRCAPTLAREDRNVSTQAIVQSWSHWAGRRIKGHSTGVATVDEVHLVPGWAIRQPRRPTPDEPEDSFDVELHISGFATSRRIPELLTRSQRAFLKLARGLMSTPKLQPILRPPDTELQLEYPELLHLPPRPCEISDDYDVEALDAHFRNSGNHEMEDIQFTPQVVDPIPAELARLHDNIKSRLRLFWASSLSSRRVQLSVSLHSPDPKYHCQPARLLLVEEMLTGPDGHFSGKIRIDGSKIYTHRVGTRITSDRTRVEHELSVEAQIINAECMRGIHETPKNTIQIPITHSVVRVISDIDDTVKISRVTDGARAIFNQVFVKDLEDTVIPEMGEWYNTMQKRGVSFHYVSNCPFELFPVINQFFNVSRLPRGSIRLRSYAGKSLFNGLLSAPGARKRGNVVDVLDQFPQSKFILVGDSGEQDLELYSSLAAERPNQIAGIFIRDVWSVGLEDPTGMMVNVGLTNSPMKPRTRSTMPFPSSGSPRLMPKRAASDTDISPAHPGAIRIPRSTRMGSLPPASQSPEPSPDFKPLSCLSEDSSSSIASTGSSVSSSLQSTRPVRSIAEGEKRRWDLQNRVNKARSMMPSHIVLRVFEDPKECMEAEQIIQGVLGVN